MNKEIDRIKIREFLDLLGNEKYEIRKYSKPVLVYEVKDRVVYYSLWESDILDRYGLSNVDGWDYKEDTIFCPDWVIGLDKDDIYSDLDDDEDDSDLC